MVTWLENRALSFDVFYKQLAINGLILCPFTLMGVFRRVFTQEQQGCQLSVSGQHAFAFSAVACPRAKNEFCRFKFAQFVNTQLPLNFVGRESFLARGRGQPGEQPGLGTGERSSAQPWLRGLPGSRLL